MRKPAMAVWFGALLLFALPARGMELNPQEIGLVVDNFLVDTDAGILGLLDHQDGGSHGFTTFTNRAVYAGQPANAMITEPLATRVEWEVWHGTTLASIGGDSYEIQYQGFMKDTRVSGAEDPTYDIRWESTWYKNDPGHASSWATGEGTFQYDDPEFSFGISVDPLHPSNVTLTGSGSATLWGCVGVEISGEKNLGTGMLTATAGVSVDVPLVSDIFGSLASAEFIFEYDQHSGEYASRIEAQAFFGLLGGEEVVNGGSISAPAVAIPGGPPKSVPPINADPPNTHTLDGHWAITPPSVLVGAPAIGGSGATTFSEPLEEFGDLSNEIITLPLNQFSNFNQLYRHTGFIDSFTFPDDLPGSGIAYSFQDPSVPSTPTGGPPPGITISPVFSLAIVPEPSAAALVLLSAALVGLVLLPHRRQRAATRRRGPSWEFPRGREGERRD